MPNQGEIFLAIGESAQGVQLVKLGRAECVKPTEADLDVIILKELGKVAP